MRPRCRTTADDAGSVLLLTVGLVAVLVALLLTVTAASQVFLARRSLVAATDALALAGAQAADLDAVYSGADGPDTGEPVPLDRPAVRAAVAQHVGRAGLDERFRDFEVLSVAVDDSTVTVRTRARVRLVVAGPITGGAADVEVTAESAASTRIR